MDLDREVDRIYLQHYVPAGVVINEELDVLQFRGQTGLFLEHRPGHATLNLLQMVKPHLAAELKNAILTVRHTGLPFGKAGLQMQWKGITYPFSLDVFPLITGDGRHFLVVFNESEILPGSKTETVTVSDEVPREEEISPVPAARSVELEIISPAVTDVEQPAGIQDALPEDRAHREKWLQTFSEVLPTMICYTRADNTTLFFNSAWLTYTGRSEAIEANGGWMMGIHPDDQPNFLHLYNQKFETRIAFKTELRLLRFDGEYCSVTLNAVPMINAADIFEGYMISFAEIAGRNVLPLDTGNLSQQSTLPPQRPGPETVEAPPSLEAFVKTDLNAVVKKLEKEFEWLIAEKKANIQFDQLPIVHAMPQQMEQLFYHLIGNALKFSHKERKPELWISSKKLSGEKLKRYQPSARSLLYYEIIVQDNGAGLSARQEFPGTGTELALCRKIVQHHKGDIYAESRENEGTRVHVILPARQDITSSFPA